MRVRCSSCGYGATIGQEESIRLETERCPDCGSVGMLKCSHASCPGGGCVDCGADFSEIPSREPVEMEED